MLLLSRRQIYSCLEASMMSLWYFLSAATSALTTSLHWKLVSGVCCELITMLNNTILLCSEVAGIRKGNIQYFLCQAQSHLQIQNFEMLTRTTIHYDMWASVNFVQARISCQFSMNTCPILKSAQQYADGLIKLPVVSKPAIDLYAKNLSCRPLLFKWKALYRRLS